MGGGVGFCGWYVELERLWVHSRTFFDVCETERNRAERIVASERHGYERG